MAESSKAVELVGDCCCECDCVTPRSQQCVIRPSKTTELVGDCCCEPDTPRTQQCAIRPSTSAVVLKPRTRSNSACSSSRKSSSTIRSGAVYSLPSTINTLSVVEMDPELSMEQVEAEIKCKLKRRLDEVIKAFQSCALETDSLLVPKSRLQRILASFCRPVTDNQLECLLQCVQGNDTGAVNFMSFLSKYTDNKATEHLQRMLKREAEKNCIEVYKGPVSAEELEVKIKNQCNHNLSSIVRALRVFDYNNEGTIQKHELRKLVESFVGEMSDKVFDGFWTKYDVDKSGVVNYRDFLLKLGVNVSKLRNQLPINNVGLTLTWPEETEKLEYDKSIAIRHGCDDPRLKGLGLDQICHKLIEKIRKKTTTLERAFLTFDPRGTGFCGADAFRSVLVHFLYPMTTPLFRQVLRRMDFVMLPKVSWREFLDRYRPRTTKLSPSDSNIKIKSPGRSSVSGDVCVCESEENNKVPETPKDRPDQGDAAIENKENVEVVEKTSPSKEWCCEANSVVNRAPSNESSQWTEHVREQLSPIISHLEDRNIHPSPQIKTAFRTIDTKGNPAITRQELRLLLARYESQLSETEVRQFLGLLDPEHTNIIPYLRFCQAFNGQLPRIQPKDSLHQDLYPKIQLSDLSFPDLTPSQAFAKLKRLVHKNMPLIKLALMTVDHEEKNYITIGELRRVLDQFCCRLSNPQFQYLVERLDYFYGKISYVNFLEVVKESPNEKLERWSSAVEKLLGNPSTQPLSTKQVNVVLREALLAYWPRISEELRKLDIANRGVIEKTEFRKVLNKYMFRLNDDQFEILWESLPKNDRGNLDYKMFLSAFEIPKVKKKDRRKLEMDDSGPRRPGPQGDDGSLYQEKAVVPLQDCCCCCTCDHVGLRRTKGVCDCSCHSSKSDIRPKTSVGSRSATKLPSDGTVASSRPSTVGAVGARQNLAVQLLNTHYEQLLKKSLQMDKEKTGKLSLKSFKEILEGYGIAITPKVRHLLCKQYCLPACGEVDYQAFLSQFEVASNQYPIRRVKSSGSRSTQERTVHMRPELRHACTALQSHIKRNSIQLKRSLHAHDKFGNGVVDALSFRNVLRECGIPINEEQFFQVVSYLDPDLTGHINYFDFFRIFV